MNTLKTVSYNGRTIELIEANEFYARNQASTRSLNEASSKNLDGAGAVATIGGLQIFSKTAQAKGGVVPTESSVNTRSLDTPDDALEVPIYRKASSGKLFMPTGEIYLIFKSTAEKPAIEALLNQYDLNLVKDYGNNRLVVATKEKLVDTVSLVAKLTNESIVAVAEPDLDGEAELYELPPLQVPLLGQQWHIENNGDIPGEPTSVHEMRAGADARIKKAWEELGNYGADDIKIAVNDLGFDIAHPDLSEPNKVLHAFDMWMQTEGVPDGTTTTYTHGTPCAGIAAAGLNQGGTVGVAPNAKLMLLHGTSYAWQHFRLLVDYCIERKVDIVSLSWGQTRDDDFYPLSDNVKFELDRLTTEGRDGKGCIVLVAAGNEGMHRINYLATHPNVIAVGSSSSKDGHPQYSNRGKELTVTAPGGDWPLLAPKASWATSHWFTPFVERDSQFDNYTHFTGTSGATPLVAGICALVLSANKDLTAKEVKQILIQSADKIGDSSEYNGKHSTKFGFGRVNAAAAVKMAKDPTIVIDDVDVEDNNDGDNNQQGENDAHKSLQKAVVRVGSRLNVRLEPNAQGDLSHQLKDGSVVWIKRRLENGWVELATTYVHGDFVEKI